MRIPGIEPPLLRAITRRMSVDTWVSSLPDVHTVLLYDLNGLTGLEELRRCVEQAFERVPPGGLLAAVARCCDSGRELAEILDLSGSVAKITNLSNKDIACLKPTDIVFLANVRTHKGVDSEDEGAEEKLRKFIEEVFPHTVIGAVSCDIPHKFAVKLLDVGLIWEKPEDD